MASAHIELSRTPDKRQQYMAAEAIDALIQARHLVNVANGLILGILNGGSNTDVETIFQIPTGTGAALAFDFASLASALNTSTVNDILNDMT